MQGNIEAKSELLKPLYDNQSFSSKKSSMT